MDHIGIDLHKRESQICILGSEGAIIERRIRTTVEDLARLLAGRERAKILLEASTESEWVARSLEALGHEVVVADPSFAPMYVTRARVVKTDRRDARALAEACRGGIYRAVHRTSEPQRRMRGHLAVREALVRTRTRYISLVRALLRRDGWRIRSGKPTSFGARVRELPLPDILFQEIAPILAILDLLAEQIPAADRAIEGLAAHDATVHRLQSVPGVGPVTAAAFVAAIDDVHRFPDAHHVQAYLGLVPREWSSGDRQVRGRITKVGHPRARTLLVQAALCLLRVRPAAAEGLTHWARRVADRRGKRIAMVALARRLAGILYALMRDETTYRPRPHELPADAPA
jgi:transposase